MYNQTRANIELRVTGSPQVGRTDDRYQTLLSERFELTATFPSFRKKEKENKMEIAKLGAGLEVIRFNRWVVQCSLSDELVSSRVFALFGPFSSHHIRSSQFLSMRSISFMGIVLTNSRTGAFRSPMRLIRICVSLQECSSYSWANILKKWRFLNLLFVFSR
jgi:hypothetical protein